MDLDAQDNLSTKVYPSLIRDSHMVKAKRKVKDRTTTQEAFICWPMECRNERGNFRRIERGRKSFKLQAK